MNGLDYAILVILVIGLLSGAIRGLIHSFFQLAGLIIAIIIAKKYYTYVSDFIISNTNIDNAIHSFINKKNVSEVLSNGGLLEELYLLLPTGRILNDFTGYITMILINCITLFITFTVVRICIALLEIFLKEVFKLPVLSTINHSGGAIFGLVETVLALLLVYAILVPVATFGRFDIINKAIETSTLSKYFYSYNFILKWIFDNALNIILK